MRPLSRYRRGRKTETSSDASDEAPERARNDAPKEVKLHEGSILFSRHSGEVSQASIRRRSRGDRPTEGGGFIETALPGVALVATLPRGKSVCCGDPGHAPSRVGENSIPKNQTRERDDLIKSGRTSLSPNRSRPQVCPGSLSRVSAKWHCDIRARAENLTKEGNGERGTGNGEWEWESYLGDRREHLGRAAANCIERSFALRWQ